MSKNKNPLAGIAKFYEDSVKKADKAGFTETFKQATDLLFERIKKELDMDLHFEDVNFGDGYFIFGYGTNSVVSFHIKEAPGWLGGIWWNTIATEETKDKKNPTYETDKLHCELFFQYEEEIDKFKPSASMFGSSFEFHFENGYLDSGFIDAYEDLQFIIKEPYLAFYKEMHYTNFNHEYISRESAKRYWNRHWKEKAKKKEIDKLNANEFMNMVKTIIKPAVEDGDAFIVDRGDCISPRYEIIMKNINLDDGKPWVKKDGCYGIFGFNYEDVKEDKKLWKKVEKECAKREKCRYYFHQPCHDSIIILSSNKFKKCLEESIADNSIWYYKKEDGTLFETEAEA